MWYRLHSLGPGQGQAAESNENCTHSSYDLKEEIFLELVCDCEIIRVDPDSHSYVAAYVTIVGTDSRQLL
jgi:hypothetical protein